MVSAGKELRAVTRAAERAALSLRARDDAIVAAHANGATLRAIAAASGLTFGRIGQIVRARSEGHSGALSASQRP